MKAIISVIALVASAQASALTLASGETAQFGNTIVKCEGSAKRCSMRADIKICPGSLVRVSIDEGTMGDCLTIESAAEKIKALRAAGVCD